MYMPKIKLSKDRPLDEQVRELLSTVDSDSTEMVDFDLSGNGLGKIPQLELINMMNIITRYPIQSINFTHTGLQLKTGNELAELIDSLKDSTVTSINLTGNFLGYAKTDEDLHKLFSTFHHSSLKSINLSNNNLGRLELGVFKELLQMLNKGNIEKIQLDANEFDRLGGPHFIAELFAKNLGKKIVLDNSDTFTKQVNDHLPNVFVSESESHDGHRQVNFL